MIIIRIIELLKQSNIKDLHTTFLWRKEIGKQNVDLG